MRQKINSPYFIYKIFSRLNFVFGLISTFVLGILLSSFTENNESTKIEITKNPKIVTIKKWFEENESDLRLTEAGPNYRTGARELILPFFKKEPDWDKFHQYKFEDGREVFEINLGNEQGYFLKSMLDSFPDQDVSKIAIQNILFIKHPTLERYDPLIARYFPDNDLSIRDFESISYNGFNEFWSGKIEVFTYDEHHYISFVIAEGVVIGTLRHFSEPPTDPNSKISDCHVIVSCGSYLAFEGQDTIFKNETNYSLFCKL